MTQMAAMPAIVRLPAGLTRLAFPAIFCGCRLQVEVTPQDATCSLRDGALRISRWGERVEVIAGSAVARAIPSARELPAPALPAGCALARRWPRLADTSAMYSGFGGHADRSAEAV